MRQGLLFLATLWLAMGCGTRHTEVEVRVSFKDSEAHYLEGRVELLDVQGNVLATATGCGSVALQFSGGDAERTRNTVLIRVASPLCDTVEVPMTFEESTTRDIHVTGKSIRHYKVSKHLTLNCRASEEQRELRRMVYEYLSNGEGSDRHYRSLLALAQQPDAALEKVAFDAPSKDDLHADLVRHGLQVPERLEAAARALVSLGFRDDTFVFLHERLGRFIVEEARIDTALLLVELGDEKILKKLQQWLAEEPQPRGPLARRALREIATPEALQILAEHDGRNKPGRR
jgi:hypothetical protein